MGERGSFGEKNRMVDAKSHIMSFILTRLSLCRNTGDMSFSFVTIGVVHPVYGIWRYFRTCATPLNDDDDDDKHDDDDGGKIRVVGAKLV